MRRTQSTATTSAASNNWHPMSSQNILRIAPGWRDPNDLKEASSSAERRSQLGQRSPKPRNKGRQDDKRDGSAPGVREKESCREASEDSKEAGCEPVDACVRQRRDSDRV